VVASLESISLILQRILSAARLNLSNLKCKYQQYNKQVIADSSGNWIADFSDSFDIVPGTWVLCSKAIQNALVHVGFGGSKPKYSSIKN
jgi:hypothetical protein